MLSDTLNTARKNFRKKFKYSMLLTGGSPSKKFVIYTRGRTGSTVLSDLINCHPDIFCDVEIFNFIYSNSEVKFPHLYIKSCSKRAALFNKKVYGFKVKISQLQNEHKYEDYAKILEELSEDGWKFIHLKRMNHLRHKISNLFTTKENIYHVKSSENLIRPKIEVDCQLLFDSIKFSENVERTEEENLSNIPNLKLIYEKDLSDNTFHQQTANKVFQYLGLPSHAVTTEYRRLIPENLEDIIINYDELNKCFKDTEYSKFLNGK
ncbi:MAG: hypothetical protein SGI89_07030 [bacterium]|nr:hypothetical protein [bacterium]